LQFWQTREKWQEHHYDVVRFYIRLGVPPGTEDHLLMQDSYIHSWPPLTFLALTSVTGGFHLSIHVIETNTDIEAGVLLSCSLFFLNCRNYKIKPKFMWVIVSSPYYSIPSANTHWVSSSLPDTKLSCRGTIWYHPDLSCQLLNCTM
jgi:hypothetical protein